MRLLHQTAKLPLICRQLTPTLVNNHHVATLQKTYTTKKFPDLLYFPHTFRWLNTKLKFKYLQYMWDPEFSEGAFIHGSTTAICKITDIINKDQPEQLRNLLTPNAELNLRSDMEYKLTKTQKEVIRLRPNDIKIFVPWRVQLVRDNTDRRICLVLLKSLSMKWFQDGNQIKLALVVIETEFKRDYSTGAKPEWIISMFHIVQCALIGGQPNAL